MLPANGLPSDWPICPITETERPHRMGAALTYARRYSLFTLVGIAGEDDLDAPDLLSSTQLGSRRGAGAIKPLVDNSEGLVLAAVRLDAAASAQLRDLMLSELNAIGSEDEAARWAHRHLPEKNKLNDRDAEHIEETFRARLSSFAIDHVEEMAELTGNAQASGVTNVRRRKAKATTLCIDRSALGHPEPRRIRDRQHVRFVARQTCLVCGRHPCDAHHLRVAQSRALGHKVSDEFTVPLCRGHHRELHRRGDEAAWWQTTDIDPFPAARALWLQTHPPQSPAITSALAATLAEP